jgi:iron-sulfur cluster assembly accessory protein
MSSFPTDLESPSEEVVAPSEEAIAPPKLHLTESAIATIREMLEDEDLLEEGGLRITARIGAGCSTPMQFGLVLEPWPEPDDIVLSGHGLRIFLDARSAWSLDGLMVDYVDTPGMGSGFAFRHPQGASGRSC